MKTTPTKSKAPNLLQRTPGGNWTFRVKRTVDGVVREKWISTGTPVKATALVEARRLMEEINRAHREGRWEKLGHLNWRSDAAGIGELRERYFERIEREAVRPPGLAARNAYWRNLRGVIAWSRTPEPDDAQRAAVDELAVSVLSEELVKSFRANWLSVVPSGDLRAEASRRRSGDSMLNQARACFSPEALRCYAGLAVPDLGGFLKAGGFGSTPPQHEELSGARLGEMAREADALKQSNPRLYVVHLLAKFLGLRNNEVWAVRVGWFKEIQYQTDGPWQWVLEFSERCNFLPKGFSFGQVPVKREVMAELASAWRALGVDLENGDAWAVPGVTETERRNVVDREHAEWVRAFVPAEEFAKAGYELRRWARQRMAAKYRSREVGEAFIRHKGPADAGRHYQARFYSWGELGADVGISLEDARGGVSGGATAAVRSGLSNL